MRTKSTPAAIALLLLGAVGTTGAQTDAEPQVDYRRALMQAQSGHLAAMFQIAAAGVAESRYLEVHARSLLELTRMTEAAYKPRTEGSRTRASPKIWDDWKGFVEMAQTTERAAADLVGAIASGDRALLAVKLDAAGDTCSGCHQKYREKKN